MSATFLLNESRNFRYYTRFVSCIFHCRCWRHCRNRLNRLYITNITLAHRANNFISFEVANYLLFFFFGRYVLSITWQLLDREECWPPQSIPIIVLAQVASPWDVFPQNYVLTRAIWNAGNLSTIWLIPVTELWKTIRQSLAITRLCLLHV